MAQPEPQEVLQAYVRIQRAADAEILRALRDAYKDVNRRLAVLSRQPGTELDRARALAVKKAILDAQADLFERTGKVIERRRVQAASRAIQVAGRYDEAAFAAAGRERDARALAEGLEATEARVIDAVEARLSGASRQPLSDRVYRAQARSSGVLERRINSALARGLNSQEFAREVRDLVNPNTPGGPRYAALRLARTEINNAYHAMAVAAAQAKPWITKVEWHLSKSHPKRPGGPEICEQLAGRMFKPTEVPLKPHPQCMCYITPVIDEDDDAFLDALVGGEFDEFIDKFAAGHGIDTTPTAAIDNPATPTPQPVRAPRPKPAPVPAPVPQTFQVPRINNVPEGANAARLTSDPYMRRELDLQEAIAPNTAGQLFELELVPSLGAGTGGLHNRNLRRIQIATGTRDGTTGRDIYNRAERAGFHPTCGRDHSTAQLHLAHEYGHHVHHMLDFMPIDDREDLRDLIADEAGIPRPPRVDRSSPLFNPEHLEPLDNWIKENEKSLRRYFGEYALKNERELMAEIWSAYSTNPDTKNDAIKAIGERMRQLGEAGAERGQVSRPDEDAARLDNLSDEIKRKLAELLGD